MRFNNLLINKKTPLYVENLICYPFLFPLMFGKNAVMIPINGKNAQILKTYSMLVSSATAPKTAEPIPPSPNMNPMISPANNTILSGIKSVS